MKGSKLADLDELRRKKKTQRGTTLGAAYFERNNAIFYQKDTREGPIDVQLTNFTAKIGEVVERDNGAEKNIFFKIDGTHEKGFPLPPVEIATKDFSKMNWVLDSWDSRAWIMPNYGANDKVRFAIQKISGLDIPRRVIYGHTGWRNIDDNWLFLHSAGAIGEDGQNEGIEVDLADRLDLFALPAPLADGKLREAIKDILALTELIDPNENLGQLAALLGAAFRAPLGEALPNDVSLFIAGKTGTLKTTLTALVQSFFGAGFNDRTLPANWSSTDNALEAQTFFAKDLFFVIDDFIPRGTTGDIARLHRKADRIFRGAGNRAGRKRMYSDGTLRQELFPRGVVVASGEDIPSGHSLRARLFIIEMQKGDIDLKALTAAQQKARQGIFAGTMAAFLKWLSPQIDELKETLPARQKELRDDIREQTKVAHDRIPDIQANLLLGWEMFLKFAEESGAITAGEKAEVFGEAWGDLNILAEKQADFQRHEDPGERFLELIAAAIRSGDAYLKDTSTDGAPKEAERWGWQRDHRNSLAITYLPKGKAIGWVDGTHAYLDPNPAFQIAQQSAQAQHAALTVSQTVLWRRLKDDGLTTTSADKNLYQKRIAGGRVWTVCTLKENISFSDDE